jgi:hypothetical protein
MSERSQRDELNPYTDEDELPVDEVGDLGSFEREPEYGDPDAPEPELDRLDLTADEPGPEDVDENPLGGVL